jgi:hypothetical protein
MKKILLVFSFLNLYTQAQPVITDGSDILPVGSSYPITFSSISDIGSSGANQTWDFSQESFSSIGSFDVVELAASDFENDFPTANWVFEITNMTSYYTISSSEMNINALNITALGGAGDYSTNPRKVLEFPFNFEDSYTDTYDENGSSTNLTVTYDAYGTLIMPDNFTYTNVVRVRETEEFGPTTTRYYILEPFMNIALHFDNNDFFTWIKVTLPNSIEENNVANFSLYPNPAENLLTIESPEAVQDDFILSTMDGKKIESFSMENGTRSVDISNLESGIYFISNGSFTKSFKKL